VAYAIRHLAGPDVAVLKRLLRTFGAAFGEPETYQGAVPSDDYLRALLDGPTLVALAALDGDEVVGGLAAYVLDKFERERSEVYVYDLAVAEAHRRRGIARRLLEALKPIARARGAWVMYVQADRSDAAAIALYESLGTREDVHHFDIPVD
jgi:aminoglycoside 3-N-acetyltransferase I